VHHLTCPVHQGRPTSNSSPSGKSRGDSAIIHRTVRCTPDSVRCSKERRLQNSPASGNCDGCSAIIHRTCPVYTGLSGVTAGQRLFRRQRLPAAHLLRASARRGQARPCWRTRHSTVHVRCATGHPGGPRSQSSNGRNPTTLVTWLSHRTCPVRHRTDSLHQRSCLVVGAINTPTTHHSWHPSFPLLNHLQELGIQF
jgi:hypothetical protein